MAFSQEKCDAVYAQHLMRKRRAQLWGVPPNKAVPCVCELTLEFEPAVDLAPSH